jgi:hypothetical protein
LIHEARRRIERDFRIECAVDRIERFLTEHAATPALGL